MLMIDTDIKEIGSKLKVAGRLETSPLIVYGSETIPTNGVPIKDIDRCIAHAIFDLSVNKEIDSIYVGNGALEGCCPGGQAWLGYKSIIPQLKYFISTGSKNYRNGAAEFLLVSPDIAEQELNSIGNITPINEFTVIKPYDSVNDQNLDVKEFLCFGQSEQIRNLCSLAYFQPEKGMIVSMPWGPSCASFITYPAGLTEKQKSIPIIGPTDPTGNYWFPQNYLSLGIPIKIAQRMANNLDDSFIIKRPKVAYPEKRNI
jgi:hypothetical protein